MVHQRPAALEKVRAGIRHLGRIPQRVSQRCLADRPGSIRLFHTPRLEGCSESVHRCPLCKAGSPEQLGKGLVAEFIARLEPTETPDHYCLPGPVLGRVRQWPHLRAGHDALTLPSSVSLGWSTSWRPGRSRPTSRLWPHPSAPRSTRGIGDTAEQTKTRWKHQRF